MPVIVGALAMINKETDKHIKKISGSPSLYEIPKITPCRTAHILRKVRSIWLKKYQLKEAVK